MCSVSDLARGNWPFVWIDGSQEAAKVTLLYTYSCALQGCGFIIKNAVPPAVGGFTAEHKLVSGTQHGHCEKTLVFISLAVKKKAQRFNTHWPKMFPWLNYLEGRMTIDKLRFVSSQRKRPAMKTTFTRCISQRRWHIVAWRRTDTSRNDHLHYIVCPFPWSAKVEILFQSLLITSFSFW